MAMTDERLLNLAKGIVDSTKSGNLTKNSMFFDEGYLDSFGLMQLLAEIETEFSISIDTEDLTTSNFASINHMTVLVDRYLAK